MRKKLVLGLFLFALSCSAAQLKDIKITTAQDMQSLELAHMQFIFDEMPLVTLVPERSNDRVSFIIPNSSVSNKVNHFVRELQQWGSVTVTPITNPVHGIKISIAYDPAIALYQSQETQSDQLIPMFVVRFFNKKLLHKLEEKKKPLLELTQVFDSISNFNFGRT